MARSVVALRLCTALVAVSLCVCSSVAAAQPRIVDDVESQISLRRWNTKGAGEAAGSETLTVVMSESGAGDVVILTWSQDRTSFTAEVYRPLPAVNKLREWESVGSTPRKKLSDQPRRLVRDPVHPRGPRRRPGLADVPPAGLRRQRRRRSRGGPILGGGVSSGTTPRR